MSEFFNTCIDISGIKYFADKFLRNFSLDTVFSTQMLYEELEANIDYDYKKTDLHIGSQKIKMRKRYIDYSDFRIIRRINAKMANIEYGTDVCKIVMPATCYTDFKKSNYHESVHVAYKKDRFSVTYSDRIYTFVFVFHLEPDNTQPYYGATFTQTLTISKSRLLDIVESAEKYAFSNTEVIKLYQFLRNLTKVT